MRLRTAMNSAFVVFVTGSVRSELFFISHLIIADGSYGLKLSEKLTSIERKEMGVDCVRERVDRKRRIGE